MSKSARTDEIDALVSSVRDFVSHKDLQKDLPPDIPERLVLTPEQLVRENAPEEIEPEPDSPTNVEAPEAAVVDIVHRLRATQPDEREGLEEKIAELEAAVTAQPDEWEADEGESFEDEAWAFSAFQTPRDDSTDSDEAPGPEDEAASELGEIPPTDDDDDEAATDDVIANLMAAQTADAMAEDALRAMITEIVHEELTGELGERMTRNVRKLVRREINRVLLSRELGQD
ncbi:hypothetical protein [Loktanella sp. Alg231-35]|uniref:hypothetical protein n=1 Tax=Loktanella sp. Alg231-35 TaxID=1922220 RepID=UPI000D54B4B8|nr:hypothetical protein [Loktanella sp. Alg231-35]